MTQDLVKLCERASQEQDSEQLMVLVKEINRLLDEKEQSQKTDREKHLPPRDSHENTEAGP